MKPAILKVDLRSNNEIQIIGIAAIDVSGVK